MPLLRSKRGATRYPIVQNVDRPKGSIRRRACWLREVSVSTRDALIFETVTDKGFKNVSVEVASDSRLGWRDSVSS